MHQLYAVILAIVASTIIYIEAPTSGVPPTARFTAYPLQSGLIGGTCVAPCGVQFDAWGHSRVAGFDHTESVHAGWPDIIHTHTFAWDFGDPNGDPVWEHTNRPKNTDVGWLAGHIYETPGSYTVTLRVIAPDQTSATFQAVVAVADPNTAISAANTYCFANDALDWNGCPLNCAGGDDNCTVTSDLDQALVDGANCVGGVSDCATAVARNATWYHSGTKARVLFRKGDTFTSGNNLAQSDVVGPGVMGSFGTGADPILSFGSNQMTFSNYWTMDQLLFRAANNGSALAFGVNGGDVNLSGGAPGQYGITFNRSRFEGSVMTTAVFGFVNPEDNELGWPTLVGRFDTEDAYTDDSGSNAHEEVMGWFGGRSLVWMGGKNDRNNPGVSAPQGTGYSMRGIGDQHVLIKNALWTGMYTDAIQLRADDKHNSTYCTGNACTWTDTRFFEQGPGLVADNVFDSPLHSTAYMFTVCDDSGCNCLNAGRTGVGPSSTGCGDTSTGHIVNTHDWIFERNLFRRVAGTPTGARAAMLRLSGGKITVRNNVDSEQTLGADDPISIVEAEGVAQSWTGTSQSAGVWVYSNTATALNNGYTRDFYAVKSTALNGESGCTSNCIDQNNLCVWGGALGGGGSTCAQGAGFAMAGNHSETADIFDGTIPGDHTENMYDFVPAVGQTDIVDASVVGFTSVLGLQDRRDARGLFRPAAVTWDIGAVERNGVSAIGDEFHVVASGGSDANAGTAELPLATIARAFQLAGPGDTIWIHSGTYTTAITTDTMAITGGSSWATRLLVAEWPGDSVIIQPASGTRVVFMADNAARYVEFRDIEFDAVNVTSDAVKITYTTNATQTSHHIRFRGGRIHNAGDGVIAGNDLDQGVLISDGIGNELIGVEIDHNGDAANKDHGVYVSTDGNRVEGCNIHDNAAAGITVFDGTLGGVDPDNNVITDNDIHDNGTAGSSGEGVEMCGNGNSVTLNRIYSNQADGVLIFDDNNTCDAVNNVVRYNWVYTNGGGSVVDDVDASGSILTPNRLAAP